jgi:dTDP-4-dehydrorhamnose reductase
VYISTAGIFDGAKELYDDWDTPNPLGHYARSKYLGELAVSQRVRDHLICRAGWMMGGGPTKDKKFVQKIMSQIKSGHKELFIVDDKFGTPTYTHDFAKNVQLLIEKKRWGLFNLVCDGQTGRLDVAREIINILGLQTSIKITAVDSKFFDATYFAPRPSSEMLHNRKLNLLELNIMRDWRTALRDYISVAYTNYL